MARLLLPVTPCVGRDYLTYHQVSQAVCHRCVTANVHTWRLSFSQRGMSCGAFGWWRKLCALFMRQSCLISVSSALRSPSLSNTQQGKKSTNSTSPSSDLGAGCFYPSPDEKNESRLSCVGKLRYNPHPGSYACPCHHQTDLQVQIPSTCWIGLLAVTPIHVVKQQYKWLFEMVLV